MKTTSMTRVTIIGTDSLRGILIDDMKHLGAKGYTYEVVSGAGELGVRPSDWAGPNVKIEVVTTADNADRILEHVAQKYFDDYPVIAFLDEVRVARPEKFGAA